MKLPYWICLLTLFWGCGSVYKSKRAEQVPPYRYQALLDSLDNPQLLDIRTPLEYKRGHLDGAANMNYLSPSFRRMVDSLDRTRPTFIYCQTAHRSPMVTKILLEKGFERVVDLEGGFSQYRKWETDQASPKEK